MSVGSRSPRMHHSTNSSTSCAYASRVCGLAPVSDDANASVRQVACLLTRAPFRADRAARSRPGHVTALRVPNRRSRSCPAASPQDGASGARALEGGVAKGAELHVAGDLVALDRG